MKAKIKTWWLRKTGRRCGSCAHNENKASLDVYIYGYFIFCKWKFIKRESENPISNPASHVWQHVCADYKSCDKPPRPMPKVRSLGIEAFSGCLITDEVRENQQTRRLGYSEKQKDAEVKK